MPYKSEQAFSKALMIRLSKQYSCINRIESGTTGLGIPDIYLRARGREYWIELKNDPRQILNQMYYHFDWRKGQQAWHLGYYKACGLSVVNILAVRDGFVIYELKQHHPKGIVPFGKCYTMDSMVDIMGWLRNDR